MKKLCLILALLCFAPLAFAQTFYEVNWSTENIEYTGLVIYYSDDDILVRVKYVNNGAAKVAEFDATGEYFDEDGYSGYLLDGVDARIVRGQNSTGYSADNFIFVKQSDGQYANPVHIDDSGLEKSDSHNYFSNVNYWKELNPNDFTSGYIGSFFNSGENLHGTLMAYVAKAQEPPLHGSGKPKAGQYRIDGMAYGNGTWALTMSQGLVYDEQAWKRSAVYPKDWIREKWDKDYYITDLSYGAGEWAVSMSTGVPYTTQSWKVDAAFPQDWISEKWGDAFYITSVSYGNGEWGVVMSKGGSHQEQTWVLDATFPSDWIEEKWNEDYYITSIAYGDGQWAVVMSQGLGYTTQSWKLDAAYPKDWIGAKWADGYYLTNITFGGGEWAVIASKGGEHQEQAWKTSVAFPSEWVEAKWGGSEPVREQPTPEKPAVQPAKMHLVMVANTLIGDIGGSCEVDKKHVVDEMTSICEALGIALQTYAVDGRTFTRDGLDQTLSKVTPGKNDIVVFVYSGHGFRWSNQASRYPTLDMRYSSYQPVNEANAYGLEEIYKKVASKGARLSLVIGDCCNSDIGISARGGQASIASRRQYNGNLEKLKQLFLEAKGSMVIAAAQPYETSCGNSLDGGYFIKSFLESLNKETSHLTAGKPSWNALVQRAISSARYKTDNLDGCSPQNGIYSSSITE